LKTESSVPFLFFRAKVFSSAKRMGKAKKISSELAYYVNWGIFWAFDSRENVSACRNAQWNLFSETLFIQKSSFHGKA
jgi:hypothetical protein